jgi:hypothetical protein
VSVVVGEFEVVPEQERAGQPAQPQAQAPPATDAQRRHELEDELRRIQSRAERLRAD